MSAVPAMTGAEGEQAMSVERTRTTITAYLEALVGGGNNGAHLVPDATLTRVDSGEVTRGRESIVGMLDFIHTCAFAAKLDITAVVLDERGG